MVTHGNGTSAGLSADLKRRLREVGWQVPPEEIGDVWIFPPLPELDDSREFLLFTRCRAGGGHRVYSARSVIRDGSDGQTGVASGELVENGDSSANQNSSANGNGAVYAMGAMGAGGVGTLSPGGGQELVEHGSVPASRVAGFIERFRRRLREDREPLHLVIGGSVEEWERWIPSVEARDCPAD